MPPRQRRALGYSAPERLAPDAPGRWGILSGWILGQAQDLEQQWAAAGWAPTVIRTAQALADSILDAWGPGPYCIRRWVEWRERGVRPGVEIRWLRHPR